MLNLLGNAVKYTENGHITLTILGEIIIEDTILLTIGVGDTGRGIKDEDKGKLFNNFAQVDLESNKGIEGTGLGLAITHNLVKAMGGEIKVASQYGHGSTFTVTLPQKFSDRTRLALVENPAKKSAIIFERRELCAYYALRAMKDLGVNCTLVWTLSELHEKMQEKPYPFVFIAPALYDDIKKICDKHSPDAKIVLLAEFGETLADKDVRVLFAPIYTIPVANVLNGVHDSLAGGRDLDIRFTPQARILVVDDIGTNLKVVEGLLGPYQMQVELCKSGKEADARVANTRYDIVFMDHMMTEMDGREAMSRIRAMEDAHPHYGQVPIIALTANAVSGIREQFLRDGFNDYLSKPINTVKLNSILEKWIPKNMQEPPPVQPEDMRQEPGCGVEIYGIDVQKGIIMTGGTLEAYVRALGFFYEDCVQKIKEIPESLETGNLRLYTTYVHAMKSASASIGAEGLSEAAKALELAGNQRDVDFIQANTGQFLTELEKILLSISTVIGMRDKFGASVAANP